MDTTLQSLIDRQSITDQLYRYCRSVDRLDVPLGHALWHEDGLADYGDIYKGPGRGVIDFICEAHLLLLHHSHQISNILITLHGDRAGSEAYVTATLRLQDQDQLKQMTVWGRYIDEWSRGSGGWKIDKRQTIIDFDEIRPVVPLGHYNVGRRDTDDPSYNVLGDLLKQQAG
jgi:hypothetical protein